MDRPSSVLERFSGALGTTVRIVLGFAIFTLSPFVPAWLSLPWWLGFLTFLLGLIVVYAFSGTKEFDVWDWGVKHRVEQRTIGDDEIEYCDACGDLAGGGLMRRYAKQVAFLGSPIRTLDWGGNTYCEDCATRTPGGEEVVIRASVEDRADEQSTERRATVTEAETTDAAAISDGADPTDEFWHESE